VKGCSSQVSREGLCGSIAVPGVPGRASRAGTYTLPTDHGRHRPPSWEGAVQYTTGSEAHLTARRIFFHDKKSIAL